MVPTAKRPAGQRQKAQQKDAERLRVRQNAGKRDLDARGTVATGRHGSGQRAGAREREITRSHLEAVAAEPEMAHVNKERGASIGFDVERAAKGILI